LREINIDTEDMNGEEEERKKKKRRRSHHLKTLRVKIGQQTYCISYNKMSETV
jgi:hypothetical protein